MKMFEYYTEKSRNTCSNTLVFHVPEEMLTGEQLFSAFGKGLKAPNGYFGCNWDAFRDCLMDLSWLDEEAIDIVHGVLPKLSQNDLRIYLNILHQSSTEWRDDATLQLKTDFPAFKIHRLNIYFGESDKPKVTSLLQG